MAAVVDVTSFASTTLWESNLKEKSSFLWKNQPKGKHHLRDAVDVRGIPNDTYDFLMAPHVCEHIANPLGALLEWIRTLESRRLSLILTPLKDATLDRIEHLIDDYRFRTNESDHCSEEINSQLDI